MAHLSEFPDYDVDKDDYQFHDRLIKFFDTDYYALMEGSRYNVIYEFDDRWPLVNDEVFSPSRGGKDIENWDADTERGRSKLGLWKEITEQGDMCGFDIITAISQRSLNAHFYSLWESARQAKHGSWNALLAEWTHEECCFEGRFREITIRLLSESSAIVWIKLEGGSLKALRHWLPSAQ